jgi:uncharacterized protein YjbJ (UPF0337 family)
MLHFAKKKVTKIRRDLVPPRCCAVLSRVGDKAGEVQQEARGTKEEAKAKVQGTTEAIQDWTQEAVDATEDKVNSSTAQKMPCSFVR